MPHRTRPLTQAFLYIADKLTERKPGRLMTSEQRSAIALTAATHIHPTDDDAADTLELAILRHLPHVDGNVVTRGEYALWLRREVGKVNA